MRVELSRPEPHRFALGILKQNLNEIVSWLRHGYKRSVTIKEYSVHFRMKACTAALCVARWLPWIVLESECVRCWHERHELGMCGMSSA